MAYFEIAASEKHVSPFDERQRQLRRAGCVQCHQRDSDRPSPLETAASTLGGSLLETVPYQRTPRLTNALRKYVDSHVIAALRDGVNGLRPAHYSYLMPSYGPAAVELTSALAEGDGELLPVPYATVAVPADPTMASLAGPQMVGSQGYGCISCHVWNGRSLVDLDPGSAGPDLMRVPGRIRRDWFDRYLEQPARSHPGTPMPAIFIKGQPASLSDILGGDSAKQKDALWAYFELGRRAPSPKPPPPLPIAAPSRDTALVAQIPIRLPDSRPIESITILNAMGDLVVYDVGSGTLNSAYVGAQILRAVQGRLRTNTVSGTAVADFATTPSLVLTGLGKPATSPILTFHGYDRLADGARIRRRAAFPVGSVEITETLRVIRFDTNDTLRHEVCVTGIPAGHSLEFRTKSSLPLEIKASAGAASSETVEGVYRVTLTPDRTGAALATLNYRLSPSRPPPVTEKVVRADLGPIGGSLERPGYRAVAFPRPKTVTGDDLVMPSALAVDPKDGRVFVASFKSGSIYVLRDPTDDGSSARFDDYTGGMFQEALSMLAEPDALYVLHRRNLTRITESTSPTRADERPQLNPRSDEEKKQGSVAAKRFDRIAALPQGVIDTYDYGYGLARDKTGAFVFSYAPYGDGRIPGAGGALRFVPGREPEEVAFGFRNPIGWCSDGNGDVFFSDNQGEWVAANKFCHLTAGRFYGFPNSAQPQHTSKPRGKAAVWVPYSWARSINGVTCDNTNGKFGPFAGQFFLAELMFGGAIIRADLEKVNGEYQGACFPFWGQGLLGPLTLAFDPKGRLFVGSITEPGWMAQPDRGAMFRIDYTGDVPFEIRSIRIRYDGFRLILTRPASRTTAIDPASYRIESYRYEYTGAYGSPELDRTSVEVEKIEASPDGLNIDLFTAPLVKDRVYLIQLPGVRSAAGEPLVHPKAAYTVNEIPNGSRP